MKKQKQKKGGKKNDRVRKDKKELKWKGGGGRGEIKNRKEQYRGDCGKVRIRKEENDKNGKKDGGKEIRRNKN